MPSVLFLFLFQALLKLDCQGLVARLVKDFALLTAAVEVSDRWRELAEKLAKVSRKQMDAYEAPYQGMDGAMESEVWHRNTHTSTCTLIFIFSKHFILVRAVDLEMYPRKAGSKGAEFTTYHGFSYSVHMKSTENTNSCMKCCTFNKLSQVVLLVSLLYYEYIHP